LSVRLVMQAALEAEISEFLGRDRYARGERERAGYRNGHAELTVKTAAGPVVLERPKLRGTAQPFASRLLGKGVSRTNALEAPRATTPGPASSANWSPAACGRRYW
jgi:putative transposase